MSTRPGYDGGRPRSNRRAVALPPLDSQTRQEGQQASDAMVRKLRRNHLKRRARQTGLELRHSTYGYSLIDAARNRIEGRNDLTLDEVESILATRA
jgi:hypothetical protein